MTRRLLIAVRGFVPFAVLIILAVSLTVPRVHAQTCSPAVDEALTAIGQNCTELGRNTACYGYTRVEASFNQAVEPGLFTSPADVVEVGRLQTLLTYPFDAVTGEWGVAVMRIQADIPDTLPGQAVTFLLMGDVEVVNAYLTETTPDSSPMQAFLFRTGVNQLDCEQAPDTLIVQGPQGTNVTVNVNGADVTIGSTVQFISMANAPERILDGLMLPPGVRSRLQSEYGDADDAGESCHLMHLRVISGAAILNAGTAEAATLPAGNAAWSAYCLLNEDAVTTPALTGLLRTAVAPPMTGGVIISSVPTSSYVSAWGAFRAATAEELAAIDFMERIPANLLNYPIVLPEPDAIATPEVGG